MIITMISNALSHHQKPFCDAVAGMESVEFYYIATKPLAAERKNMGYADLNDSESYIVRSYESQKEYARAVKLTLESDFVIFGSAPYKLIKKRLKQNKWTFQYSERIFKKQGKFFYQMKLFLIYFLRYGIYAHNRMKVLCASAYTPKDFKRIGFRQNQMYTWGYFPKVDEMDIPLLLRQKEPDSLLWVGRMIAWKHPETAIKLAAQLKAQGLSFHLTMVGTGELFEGLRMMVDDWGLSDCVVLTGSLPTADVRKVMEKSAILLATSDQNEGWGAVINEAMSGSCAVCASREMGAAPFLIKDGENGYLIQYDDQDMWYQRVSSLLTDDTLRMRLAVNAYQTMNTEWNGQNAAKKLVELCEHIVAGEEEFSFSEGIGSTPLIHIDTKGHLQ